MPTLKGKSRLILVAMEIYNAHRRSTKSEMNNDVVITNPEDHEYEEGLYSEITTTAELEETEGAGKNAISIAKCPAYDPAWIPPSQSTNQL